MRSRIFLLEEVLFEAIEVYGQSDSGGAEAGGGRDGGAGSVPRAWDQYGDVWASPEIPDTEIRCKDGLRVTPTSHSHQKWGDYRKRRYSAISH